MPSDYLRKYVDYIRNTGQVPLKVADFDDDWEPIGPQLRQDLQIAGLITQDIDGIRLKDDHGGKDGG